MSNPATDAETWADLYGTEYAPAVDDLLAAFPDERSLRVDWHDLHERRPNVADGLLHQPEGARDAANTALTRLDAVDGRDVAMRLHNLPDRLTFRVGKQRSNHLGNAIGIEGRVEAIDSVESYCRQAALECLECGVMNHMGQYPGEFLHPPQCMGCEKSSASYKLIRSQSEIVDYRRIVLEPADSNLDEPPTLIASLTEDLVESVGTDDYVTLVGIYDTTVFPDDSVLSTYLSVWDLEEDERPEIDSLGPAEIRTEILERIERWQNDGDQFGASADRLMDEMTELVRETDVEDQMEELVEQNQIRWVDDERLMTR